MSKAPLVGPLNLSLGPSLEWGGFSSPSLAGAVLSPSKGQGQGLGVRLLTKGYPPAPFLPPFRMVVQCISGLPYAAA